MTTIHEPLSSKLNGSLPFQNLQINKIKAFIISRVIELKTYGWTTNTIAEALGVSEDFIERTIYLYSQ